MTTHRRLERLFYCLISALVVLAVPARCAEPNKTIISDIIYRADGTPARGTLLISWPALSSTEALTNRDIVDEGKFYPSGSFQFSRYFAVSRRNWSATAPSTTR